MDKPTIRELEAEVERLTAEKTTDQEMANSIIGDHQRMIRELQEKVADAPRERWTKVAAPARYLFVKWILGNGLKIHAGSEVWSWAVTAQDSDWEYNPNDPDAEARDGEGK